MSSPGGGEKDNQVKMFPIADRIKLWKDKVSFRSFVRSSQWKDNYNAFEIVFPLQGDSFVVRCSSSALIYAPLVISNRH